MGPRGGGGGQWIRHWTNSIIKDTNNPKDFVPTEKPRVTPNEKPWIKS